VPNYEADDDALSPSEFVDDIRRAATAPDLRPEAPERTAPAAPSMNAVFSADETTGG
jgi:hypothetical protein